MNQLVEKCIDCGCKSAIKDVDEVRPMLRTTESVNLVCSATFADVFSVKDSVGRICHCGCKDKR